MLKSIEGFPISVSSMKKVSKEGSIRIDLAGGTLDLWPINLILPNAVTLNMAIDRKVYVTIEEADCPNDIIIESLDYNQTYKIKPGQTCPEMELIAQLLFGVGVTSGVKLSLQSDSPPGGGLGGSSVMGITLMIALNEWLSLNWSQEKMLRYACGTEAKVLNKGPAGYQDYYPACHGGILALRPSEAEIMVEQLFTPELAEYLESHLTLVYSGQSRESRVNNWEVYKKFFDGDRTIQSGLSEIAQISLEAYQALKKRQFSQLLSLIAREGEIRAKIFLGFAPPFIKEFAKETRVSHKMCGAGGGGCFVLIHKPNERERLLSAIKKTGMSCLDYKIARALKNG